MKPRRAKTKTAAPVRATVAPVLSARRRWLFRVGLLLAPLGLLVLMELGLRLAGYGYNPDFFKPQQIDGTNYFVQNETFSFRFFPRQMARSPGPLRFPARKAPGTYRIFILGESAAMGDPAESFAPDRYLEALLRHKYPGRNFEVINTAVTAINSHVILPIARECATHDGDLWIVYLGNNEMVGPFGAATVFGRKAPPLGYARLVTAVQRLRIGQLFASFGHAFAGRAREQMSWGGMEMFVGNQIPPGSASRERVYDNFQKNLEAIVRAGVHSGATVMLNTVGVNLRDCPPFGSLPGRTLPESGRVKFTEAYTRGVQAEGRQEWAEAETDFEQAARLDSQPADLQYHWARCLLAQSNAPAAREHFQLACDDDALPFRADARINSAIRNLPQRVAGDQVKLCDAAEILAANNPDGLCGDETFFEHVHFDFDARYRLARAWAQEIETRLPPTTNTWLGQSECERQLGLSPWNRSQVIHFMVERMRLPPLSSQANNETRRQRLETRIKSALAPVSPVEVAHIRQDLEQLATQRPDDYFLCENFAVFLELTGDVPAATTQWLRFAKLLPQDPLGYFEAGRLQVRQQKYAEAESLLRRSLAIRPSRTDGWVELGNALALRQDYTAALQCFDTALQQNESDPQIYLRRGKVLARLNQPGTALASYRAAVALAPDNALIHHELGLELITAGQTNAAGPEFKVAAQLGPENVMFRYDYGIWLLQQQVWSDAQREFEAVLHLEPENSRARKNLEWLRARAVSGH